MNSQLTKKWNQLKNKERILLTENEMDIMNNYFSGRDSQDAEIFYQYFASLKHSENDYLCWLKNYKNKTVKETATKLNNLKKLQANFVENCKTCPGGSSACEQCRKDFIGWLNKPICQDDYEWLKGVK